MPKRKEKKVDIEEELFLNQLEGKKIPLLILDVHWHELFPDHIKTPQIKHYEKEINALLKEQARLTSELKNMEKTKKQLMNCIIDNMEVAQKNEKEAKKQEKRQEYILEFNEKMNQVEIDLGDVPNHIQDVNQQLLMESMRFCYRRLKQNTQETQKLDEWIEQVREALKERLLEKQEKEMQNKEIYSYMHHMLGREVIEMFDHKVNDDEGEAIEG